MAIYRNERIPPYDFVKKLKWVDPKLHVVFDSASMRWDILYKAVDEQIHLIHRVCERDDEGRDVGYMPLDDRTISKLYRMDLKRRNITAQQYKQFVNDAEKERELQAMVKHEQDLDYIYKHEHRTLERMRDALRGVERRF